jgi:DNA mismatch endonuclease (patch repair protein)
MHRCKFGRVKPATNAEFWMTKREANRYRDSRVRRELRKTGWRVITIWECELRDGEKLQGKLLAFLTK